MAAPHTPTIPSPRVHRIGLVAQATLAVVWVRRDSCCRTRDGKETLSVTLMAGGKAGSEWNFI